MGKGRVYRSLNLDILRIIVTSVFKMFYSLWGYFMYYYSLIQQHPAKYYCLYSTDKESGLKVRQDSQDPNPGLLTSHFYTICSQDQQ